MRLVIYLALVAVLSLINAATAQSIRKDYNEMTAAERSAYINALYDQDVGDLIMEIADYHADNFEAIHFNFGPTDVFLAWHRMQLKEMEDAIQSVSPGLTIPYWNWVTDNSASDPLWDIDFLGQFNHTFGRQLGRNGFDLPSQAHIDGIQSIADWTTYTYDFEEGIVHSGGHNWTGGVMLGPEAPLDPVFYFHHAMIDKLWQEWQDTFGATAYLATSFPPGRYEGVQPNDVKDSRTLKVWYAENGEVLLDNYGTDDDEAYVYTGAIVAQNGFVVENGSDVTFTAGDRVVLGPGFGARLGASFRAQVDPATGTVMAANQNASVAEAAVEERTQPRSYVLAQNFPNPFRASTTIAYELPEATTVRLEVFDLLGRRLDVLVDAERTAGVHQVQWDARGNAAGVYVYRLTAGGFMESRRMLLAH